jgi:phosphoribosylanthranilate isomerase
MALITKVKAGSVSSLSDARYFAGMGVDWLGFDIDSHSAHYVSPELYKSMAGWVTGPKRVIEITNVDASGLSEIIDAYSPELLEVKASELALARSLTALPLIARLDGEDAQANIDFSTAEFVIVQLKEIQNRKEIITSIAAKTSVMLAVDIGNPDVASLLKEFPFSGIALQGSIETKVGLKDYPFAEILESLDEF